MSPNNPPPVTESDPLLAEIASQVAAINASKPPDPLAAAPSAKRTIGGQTYNFADDAAADRAVEEVLRQQMVERQNLEQRISVYEQNQNRPSPNQPNQAAAPPPPDRELSGDQFKTYVDLMGKNPLKAAEYLDEIRYAPYGIKNPLDAVRALASTVAVQNQALNLYQFRENNPDFPVSPQAGQAMDKIMKEFGYPPTSAGLESAYAMALKRGMITHPVKEEAPVQQAPQSEDELYRHGLPNWGAAPPPNIPRSSASETSPNTLAQFQQLNTADMERVLKNMGAM